MNSNLQFSLPDLPPGIDPQVVNVIYPLYSAVFSLFEQMSGQLGQTIIDPTLYSSIPHSNLAKLNGRRKIYLLNASGATIVAGKFVCINALGEMALSDVTAATAPVGFIERDVLTGAFGEVVFMEGHIASSGLTPGDKYQAGAAGALAAFTTGPAIAMALSATALYVRIPL